MKIIKTTSRRKITSQKTYTKIALISLSLWGTGAVAETGSVAVHLNDGGIALAGIEAMTGVCLKVDNPASANLIWRDMQQNLDVWRGRSVPPDPSASENWRMGALRIETAAIVQITSCIEHANKLLR